jgi:hypothetical protein
MKKNENIISEALIIDPSSNKGNIKAKQKLLWDWYVENGKRNSEEIIKLVGVIK